MALLATALVAVACGDDSSASACGPVETLFEPSSVHVLPGVAVTYDASPPASGPHQIPAPDPGIYFEPLAEPLQVGAVEEGLVILQYATSASDSDVTDLEALSGRAAVIVMPGARPFDDDAMVAFTAWGKRQLCESVDVMAAEEFIDRFAGVVFVNHE
ncbi:MAG: DUF3105 domain-containing protein [Acidimicrobiales bacterium]